MSGRVTNVVVWTPVRIYREGLVSALVRDERIAGVAAPTDTLTCREVLAALRPTVLVVDAAATEASELAGAARSIQSPVVVLGVVEPEREVVAFAEAGVSAYVTLEQPLDMLVASIFAVAGATRLQPSDRGMLLRHVASLAGERERTHGAASTSLAARPRSCAWSARG